MGLFLTMTTRSCGSEAKGVKSLTCCIAGDALQIRKHYKVGQRYDWPCIHPVFLKQSVRRIVHFLFCFCYDLAAEDIQLGNGEQFLRHDGFVVVLSKLEPDGSLDQRLGKLNAGRRWGKHIGITANSKTGAEEQDADKRGCKGTRRRSLALSI